VKRNLIQFGKRYQYSEQCVSETRGKLISLVIVNNVIF